MSMMKIVTCNLPEPFISAMEKLISEYGLYPSRSELIRVAVREFLIKELKVLDKFNEYRDWPDPEARAEHRHAHDPQFPQHPHN